MQKWSPQVLYLTQFVSRKREASIIIISGHIFIQSIMDLSISFPWIYFVWNHSLVSFFANSTGNYFLHRLPWACISFCTIHLLWAIHFPLQDLVIEKTILVAVLVCSSYHEDCKTVRQETYRSIFAILHFCSQFSSYSFPLSCRRLRVFFVSLMESNTINCEKGEEETNETKREKNFVHKTKNRIVLHEWKGTLSTDNSGESRLWKWRAKTNNILPTFSYFSSGRDNFVREVYFMPYDILQRLTTGRQDL